MTRANEARTASQLRWRGTVGASGPSLDAACAWFASTGRLTVNFHPDRIAASGDIVAVALDRDGRYRSQWRTGISSGSRSAMRGGERETFERSLFGDTYADADPLHDEFPLYGALDLLDAVHGGSPRFGSTYLVLQHHVRRRATYSLGDSHLRPADVGTDDAPWSLLAGLAEQAVAGRLLDRPLGLEYLTHAIHRPSPRVDRARCLDGYVEAQIHGGIDLARDVRAIVADPSFRSSPVGDALSSAARRYGLVLNWHTGSELAVDQVPDDFRGERMAVLARDVAGSAAWLTAADIGRWARHLPHRPPTPRGDPPDSDLQALKYLWHTLFAHGRDAARDA